MAGGYLTPGGKTPTKKSPKGPRRPMGGKR